MKLKYSNKDGVHEFDSNDTGMNVTRIMIEKALHERYENIDMELLNEISTIIYKLHELEREEKK